MCIYKEIEDWDNVNEISKQYFAVEDKESEIEL
jgi:hypothetical protein